MMRYGSGANESNKHSSQVSNDDENNVIRWLNWRHNKRLTNWSPDCDVIIELCSHTFIYIAKMPHCVYQHRPHLLLRLLLRRFSLHQPPPTRYNVSLSEHSEGKSRLSAYFPLHSVIKFTFIQLWWGEKCERWGSEENVEQHANSHEKAKDEKVTGNLNCINNILRLSLIQYILRGKPETSVKLTLQTWN